MPDHPSVVFNLGLCAEAGGAYETAMRHYRRAQQLDPKGRDVRDAMARVPQLIAGAAEAKERSAARSCSQRPPSTRSRVVRKIGGESCRARVWQEGENWGVTVRFKK